MNTITRLIVLAAILFLIIADVILLIRFGVEATISQVLLNWARAYPVIPFGIGFAMGHIFWPNCGGSEIHGA